MTERDFVDTAQLEALHHLDKRGLFVNQTARQAIAGRAHLVGSEVELWRRWAEEEDCPEALCEKIAEVMAALKELDKACRDNCASIEN